MIVRPTLTKTTQLDIFVSWLLRLSWLFRLSVASIGIVAINIGLISSSHAANLNQSLNNDGPLLNPFSGLRALDPQAQLQRIEENSLSPYATNSSSANALANSFLAPLASAAVDLVQYMRLHQIAANESEIDAKIPHYNRVEMFGGWVNEDSPNNCFNTRAEVLLRDVSQPSSVVFSSVNPCQVSKGDWLDPYSGTRFKLAKAVQIDHVVPLKNAFRSGAHQWPKERRCHYANFLRDPKHLLAVSGHENMSKGDSAPDTYLPPNDDYVCEYLKNWMQIKAVWSLGFTDEEANAIQVALRAHRCDASYGQISNIDFNSKRVAANRMNVKCVETQNAATEATPTKSGSVKAL
jgi:hypothetical protein